MKLFIEKVGYEELNEKEQEREKRRDCLLGHIIEAEFDYILKKLRS